jgi:hypothetical protein
LKTNAKKIAEKEIFTTKYAETDEMIYAVAAEAASPIKKDKILRKFKFK